MLSRANNAHHKSLKNYLEIFYTIGDNKYPNKYNRTTHDDE